MLQGTFNLTYSVTLTDFLLSNIYYVVSSFFNK